MDSQSRLADLHNVRAKLEEQLEQVGQGRADWEGGARKRETRGLKWEGMGGGGSRGGVGGRTVGEQGGGGQSRRGTVGGMEEGGTQVEV